MRTVALSCLCLLALAVTAEAATPNVARLLSAMRQVESGGNDHAVGDGGAAHGPYQIHKAYHDDAAEQLRREGRALPAGDWIAQVEDEPTARALVLAYWRRYSAKALAAGDLEALARRHNGGLRAANSKAAGAYWRKVRAEMQS